MKMNNDDEWISMGQATKDINRAIELDVELERCQELNAQGEVCLADNDIAKAEEYFNQADEALDKIDSEISSLEISDLKVEEYRAQARTSLGLDRCLARSVPGKCHYREETGCGSANALFRVAETNRKQPCKGY